MQEALAHEIEGVLGAGADDSSRPLSFAIPYVETFLHEVMRFRPLIPLNGFHNTTEAVHLHGHAICADTMVFINVYEAHFNWELWGDDDGEFRPERWLSASADDTAMLFGQQESHRVLSSSPLVNASVSASS